MFLHTSLEKSINTTRWNSTQFFIIAPFKLNYTLLCEAIGTHLASIHSQSDLNQTQQLCNMYYGDNPLDTDGCWIGLNEFETEKEWQWSDGSMTDYGFTNIIIPWRTGEPTGNGPAEDCV